MYVLGGKDPLNVDLTSFRKNCDLEIQCFSLVLEHCLIVYFITV